MAKEDGRLSEGAIAASAFRTYRNAFLGSVKVKGTDWDDLEEDNQYAWVSVAERALEILDDCEGLPWVKFASELFAIWARRLDYPVQEFSELTEPARAAWVAVSRHIPNLCAMEDDEDITSHEERWIGAASRLGQATEVRQ